MWQVVLLKGDKHKTFQSQSWCLCPSQRKLLSRFPLIVFFILSSWEVRWFWKDSQINRQRIWVEDFIIVFTHFLTSTNRPLYAVVIWENVNATSAHCLSFLPGERTHGSLSQGIVLCSSPTVTTREAWALGQVGNGWIFLGSPLPRSSAKLPGLLGPSGVRDHLSPHLSFIMRKQGPQRSCGFIKHPLRASVRVWLGPHLQMYSLVFSDLQDPLESPF